MIYLIWSNYDEIKIEQFKTVEEAEERIAPLKKKEDDESDHYGTTIHAVINGNEMDIKTVEVETKILLTNKIRLIDKEED